MNSTLSRINALKNKFKNQRIGGNYSIKAVIENQTKIKDLEQNSYQVKSHKKCTPAETKENNYDSKGEKIALSSRKRKSAIVTEKEPTSNTSGISLYHPGMHKSYGSPLKNRNKHEPINKLSIYMKDHNDRVKASEKYKKNNSITSQGNNVSINNKSISVDEIYREKQEDFRIENSIEDEPHVLNAVKSIHITHTGVPSPMHNSNYLPFKEIRKECDKAIKESTIDVNNNIRQEVKESQDLSCAYEDDFEKDGQANQLPDINLNSKH